LHLRVERNPDSVPVEWIFEGDSYMASELLFLLPQVDTLTAQLVLHYDYCPDTITTFIVVVPPPVFTYCHDDTLCHGVQLSVEQPNVLSYQWSDGSSGPAITLDSAGTYSVTVTNLGCRAESDLFTIDLYPQSSVEFGDDSTLCELATLLLDATQPHPAGYLWQDQSTNTTYTVYEDGQYWVVVTDHCLGASDTINIGYLSDFAVDLGPDTTLCEGRTLTLSANVPFCDYEWQDGSTQSSYIVRHPGIYSVTASNQCFEHGDDIVVEYEPCEQELWMPNSFTPDGDGLNDLFLPVFSYPDEVEEFEMAIYDRWGSVLFMTQEKDRGWDGAGVPDGVYVVHIRYKTKRQAPQDVTKSVVLMRK
ncbi:MAG: gliding motility-associated C-terminal domain-containing protein, partial [Bacteroidales bacterium]|nr:gliding motility-associated C-terminal domain-containing protein [Bacteroidales bacterium]